MPDAPSSIPPRQNGRSRRGRRARRAAIWSGSVLAAGGLLTVGVAVYTGESTVHPHRAAVPPPPGDLDVREIEFASSDGLRLSGWYVPPPEQKGGAVGRRDGAPGVVLAHGRSHSRAEFLPELDKLHEAGFAVLAFDFRGQGRSAGTVVAAGLKQQGDLSEAIGALQHQPGVDSESIGVIGHSMGAAVAMMEAVNDDRVKAVVDEAGFARFTDAMKQAVESKAGGMLPSSVVVPLAGRYMDVRYDADPTSFDPVDVVDDLRQPLLVVHAAGDREVDADQSREVFDAAGSIGKELWITKGELHAESVRNDPAGYEQHVLAFLQKSLAAPADRSPRGRDQAMLSGIGG